MAAIITHRPPIIPRQAQDTDHLAFIANDSIIDCCANRMYEFKGDDFNFYISHIYVKKVLR